MAVKVEGNLADVRKAVNSGYEVGQIVDHVDPSDQFCARIFPNVAPAWHVIETRPNQERTVASYLVARRFGMFVPESEEDIVRRGRKVHVTRLMFRGYVFVFVWDVLAHERRLECIPGVARILRDGATGSPVVLDDYLIDRIRAVENRERPLMSTIVDEVAQPQKSKRKRFRKHQKTKAELEAEHDNDVIMCRPWSAFEDALTKLDADGRNQTLLRALGLPS